jgi:hypothetical protein
MENDGTYGGVSRSGHKTYYDSNPSGGCLTLELLENAFAWIKHHDEQTEKTEREFYRRLRPFNRLLNEKDFVGFRAAYRLIQASTYPGAALHPKEYEIFVGQLTERGLWPIPIDSPEV